MSRQAGRSQPVTRRSCMNHCTRHAFPYLQRRVVPFYRAIHHARSSIYSTGREVDVQFVPSDESWTSIRRWVVFSDLHVTPRTSEVCVEVLRRVQREAERRDAGVLFLGDFWDRRGDLPVQPLNQVVTELRSWAFPIIMIPGNHDQVDIHGHHHSLVPLAAACPQAHVFTYPTLFLDALWLPYRRDHDLIQGAVQDAMRQVKSGPDPLQVKAIFAHVDILSAKMNASYQAKDGLPPDVFPPDMPVYTGHYHLPQTVEGTNITYVGSPYQVARGEEGQQKRLLVLNRDWQVEEEVHLDIGRRFFTARGPQQLWGDQGVPHNDFQAGDRLRWVLEDSEVPAPVSHELKELNRRGVHVEVVLQPAKKAVRIAKAEELAPTHMLEAYGHATKMSAAAMEVAQHILKEVCQSGLRPRGGHQPVDLQFHSVEVEGYGVFRDRHSYNLKAGGLRVVSGRNEDDESCESNAAGKTTLVNAAYWALMGKSSNQLRLDEVVHEDCTKARVVVRGQLGGKEFEVERRATRGPRGGRGQVRLVLEDEDCSSLESRLTEAKIQEMFGGHLLSRTVFWGQSDLLNLLNSSDAAFKDTLGELIDYQVWGDGSKRAAALLKRAAQDLQGLQEQCRIYQQLAAESQEKIDSLAVKGELWNADRSKRLDNLDALKVQSVNQLNECKRMADEACAILASWVAPAQEEVQSKQQQLEVLQQDLAKATAHLPSGQGITSQEDWGIAQLVNAISDLRQHVRDEEQHHLAAREVFSRFQGKLQSEQRRLKEYLSLNSSQRSNTNQTTSSDPRHHHLPVVGAADSLRLGQGHGAQQQQLRVAAAGAMIVCASEEGGEQLAEQAIPMVCDHCLQPIDRDLFMSNVARMESEVMRCEKELRDAELAARDCERSVWWTREQLRVQEAALREAQGKEQAAREILMREERERRLEMQQWQEEVFRRTREKEELVRKCEGVQRALEQNKEVWPRLEQRVNHQRGESMIVVGLGRSAGYPNEELKAEGVWDKSKSQMSPQEVQDAILRLGRIHHEANLAADRFISSSTQHASIVSEKNPLEVEEQMLRQQLHSQQERLNNLEESKVEMTQKWKVLKEVDRAFGRGGVTNYLLEGIINDLQARAATYLSQLSSHITLELRPTRTLGVKRMRSSKKNKQAATTDQKGSDGGNSGEGPLRVSQGALEVNDGPDEDTDANVVEKIDKFVRVRTHTDKLQERSLQQLSGGERKKVALALALAYADLAASRGRLNCNLVVLDEVLEKLDETGCARVADVLRGLPHETVLVVGQASSYVSQCFDVVDLVVKKGGAATVEVAL